MIIKNIRTALSFVAGLVFILVSCQKDVTSELPVNDSQEPEELPLFITGHQPDRVERTNEIVIWQSEGLIKDGVQSSQSEDRNDDPDPNDDIFWLHVADVRPLEFKGQLLSATHVAVQGEYAFVSYHLRGNEHLGVVEIIDMRDAENPAVVGQSFFENADVNAIELDHAGTGADTRIWVALSDFKKGAVLGELKVENGLFNENHFNYLSLSNHIASGITSSANSVKHASDHLYVTSGKSQGGVFKINADRLEVEGATEFAEAKYVTTNGSEDGISKVVTLQAGANSLLRTDILGNYDFTTSTTIGEIAHQNVDAASRGKNTIHFESTGSDKIYVSMGTAGLKAYDVSSGIREVWEAPASMLTAGNCNGISSDASFLYAANGADGLAVFQLLEDQDPNLVFTWDLQDQVASANFVLAAEDYVFVAKGQGGLKILKRPDAGDLLPLGDYDEDGTPKSLAADLPVCGELLSNLFTQALPEKQDATTAHPEFFDQEVIHNLYLSQGADVYLTFLHEGAGYKNTLGYYYYDADNPPASEEDLVKIIVFPNASASGSGGDLKPGNTMELLGSFSENTVIGFFLIADGWRNGLTDGLGFRYSDPQFNDGHVQSLIFYDQECEATVIAFEDIALAGGGGDKDYNDAVFMITTTPTNAIDVSTFLQLED